VTKRRFVVLATLLLIIAAGIALRLRFVDVPLNRDEGEYAYGAQLLLQGVPPYTRLYSMRWPGVYAGYAGLFSVFGATGAGIHTGLAMLGAVTTLLIFLLGRRLFGTGAGLAAAAVHALLATDGALRGFAAYSEHFVVVLALAGLALMLHAVDHRHRAIAAVAGIALGGAVTMKQPGIFFLAFAAAWMLWQTWRGGKPWVGGVVAVVAGAALPVIAMLGWLAAAGVLSAFAFWTVTYASEYVAGGSVAIAVGSVLDTLWPFAHTSAGPLLLVVAGVVALWWEPHARRRRAVIAALAVASIAAISPGLYLRPQYLLLALPVVALLAGLGTVALARRTGLGAWGQAAVASALVVIALGSAAWTQRAFLLQGDPHLLARDAYHGNPFPEAVVIGQYLRANLGPTDSVVVLGSEPEIYFYAQRAAPTGYVYMYPLMEDQRYARAMQDEFIRDIERTRPLYLVFVSVPYSWLVRPSSTLAVFAWLDQARRSEFERVGIVDIVARERTEYRWDAEAVAYTPRSRFWVEILKRRSSESGR
jgi:hypothetical protein